MVAPKRSESSRAGRLGREVRVRVSTIKPFLRKVSAKRARPVVARANTFLGVKSSTDCELSTASTTVGASVRVVVVLMYGASSK